MANGISACLCSRYTLFSSKACVRGIFPLPQSCSLFAIHTFQGKNLCRGRDEPQNNRFLLAIQGNPAKRVCRGKGNRQNRNLLFAIHTFPSKSLCQGHLSVTPKLFSVRDTHFSGQKPVSRKGRAPKQPFSVRDTPFSGQKPVSRKRKPIPKPVSRRRRAQTASKITDGWRQRGSSAPPGGRTAPDGSAGRRRCGLRSVRFRSGRARSNIFP